MRHLRMSEKANFNKKAQKAVKMLPLLNAENIQNSKSKFD